MCTFTREKKLLSYNLEVNNLNWLNVSRDDEHDALDEQLSSARATSLIEMKEH